MASDDVCEHQNAHYLRMMFERDEARRQVADLRARIERVEALTEGLLTAEGWNDPEVETVLLIQRRYRAALAGSGEQPGEAESRTRAGFRYCETCRVRVDDEHGHDHPAPAVPDSAAVRDITDQVRYAWCWYGGATREESDQRAAQFDTWLASLAVVGQGMTAEPVAVVERVHEDRPVITARAYAPESWKHLGPGMHLHAAVRPSGQEQADD